jgi:hypothetical protein
MDFNDIVQMVSSVGFPIVACIVLFKLYNNTITSFKESIDNNTKAIEALKEIINIYFNRSDK